MQACTTGSFEYPFFSCMKYQDVRCIHYFPVSGQGAKKPGSSGAPRPGTAKKADGGSASAKSQAAEASEDVEVELSFIWLETS